MRVQGPITNSRTRRTLLLALQQVPEIGERLLRHGWFSVSTRRRIIVGAGRLKPSVFVVVTVGPRALTRPRALTQVDSGEARPGVAGKTDTACLGDEQDSCRWFLRSLAHFEIGLSAGGQLAVRWRTSAARQPEVSNQPG